jgi:hypothetical protein
MHRTTLALAPILLLAPALVQERAPQAAPTATGPAELDAGTWRYETGRRMRAMERAFAAASEERRAVS